jgi:hypothetical protein
VGEGKLAKANCEGKDLTQRTRLTERGERSESGRDPSAGMKKKRRAQDDDACRIVNDAAKSSGKIGRPVWLAAWQARSQLAVPLGT